MDKNMNYNLKLYDVRWIWLRDDILERDNYTCKVCGRKKPIELHVHHLVYYENKEPWDYEGKDLITLCKYCHEYMHSPQDAQKMMDYFDSKIKKMD